MAGLVFKSTLIAITMALSASAAATSQCNSNADCMPGYICGPSDFAFSGTSSNVCVHIGTCSNAPDPQFPNEGPKCGDSIFCNVGGYCGEGYYKSGGDTILTQVCVDKNTGLDCASS
ncbi:hypothetical protein VFPPC_15586 [Pochonia chlamydosporia 170]|uniref:Uncharacterized protein n=1 Tax=Pochonia chlamydosporia 170 TaxID=1380566 RepID=A0A179FXT0_METCM|nr:hypothetical protein VFPPC_15586 [Pochonia chlamydosporia 170]OAQ70486.1 hypothetical protein VFPPC_15586 [Pochonia chlamydosporia 170]